MAQLRVEKLLASLDKEERGELERRLATRKRQSLKRLYEIVSGAVASGKKIEAEKTQVFKDIFGRAYRKSDDYLLRNEYRLLDEVIYAVMVESESRHRLAADEQAFDLTMLYALYRRKLWTELDTTYRKAKERAADACNYRAIEEMDVLYGMATMERLEYSTESFRANAALYIDALETLKCFYATESMRLRSLGALCVHHLRAAKQPIDSRAFDDSMELSVTDNALRAYYKAMTDALLAEERDRARFMQDALKQHKKLRLSSHRLKVERAGALSNVGIMHYINGDYDKARPLIEEAIVFNKEMGIPLNPALFFNYVIVLMNLKDYAAALMVVEEQQALFEDDLRVKYRMAGMKTFALIFLNRPLEASREIPSSYTRRPDSEHHLFRFAELAIAYLRGRTDDALREAMNFQRRFQRSKKVEARHDKSLAELYVKFLDAMTLLPDKKRFEKLQRLATETALLIQDYPPYQYFMPFRWLREEILKKID